MADGKIKISELGQALQLNDDAFFPYTQDANGTATTYGALITQIARKIAEGVTLTNLTTTSKNLVGAINELKSSGASILYGTTTPSSSLGSNGNLYVKYTSGSPDTVTNLYVKLDDAWCEIETGGGSSSLADLTDTQITSPADKEVLQYDGTAQKWKNKSTSIEKTIQNVPIAHFTDGADNIPVKSLVSQIVVVESGSGEKSPENPYTLSGFDNAVITRCGVNVWDEEWEQGGIDINTGNTVYATDRVRSKNFISVVSGQTYYFHFKTFSSGNRTNDVIFYDVNKNWVGYNNPRQSDSFSVTIPQGVAYIKIHTSPQYGGTYLHDISINYPSIDTQYHSYNGNTYTFAFGQTIFGGYFDNKGNLVVTHKIVDFADLGYYYSNNRFSSTDIPDVKNVSVWNSALTMCSCYDITEVQAWTQGDSIIGLYGKNIYVKDSRYTDTISFKQALTGQKFVVELANPITLSITSQDIPTLLGENNIFSNCGDINKLVYFNSNAGETVDLIDVKNPTKSITWEEYQALSNADKNNGTIYLITDVNGNEQNFQPVIYSEEEREIGVWTDGKPLYQKTLVIAGTSLTAGRSNTINHGISNVDYIQLVNGTYTFGDGGDKLPLPFADNYKPVTESAVVIEAINSSAIRIGVGSNYSGSVSPNTVWVTVQYTKTTDTAGSGQWTPQGVPAHHYSTDEQVVGTWIDGKTLYEKTVIITNAGKDASYDLGITDFDTCFVYDGSFSTGTIPYLHGSYPDNSIGGFLDETGSSLAWAFRSGSQASATISGFITVRYTKSA